MKGILLAATLSYPLVIYWSLSSGYPLIASSLLGVILAIKTFSATIRSRRSVSRAVAFSLVVLALSIGVGVLWPSSSLFYPVAISATVLVVFCLSLAFPPNIIERFARAARGDLPPSARAYCYKTCLAWIAFLCVNLFIALDSTRRSIAWWTLYNGLLSYVSFGVFFGLECLVRRRVMRSVASALALIVCVSHTPLASCDDNTTMTMEQLQARLASRTPFKATFLEQRHVAVLTAPLESRGEISVIPATGLVWNVTHPITTTSLITADGVTIIEGANSRRDISDQAHISEALLSLMDGSLERANKDFTTTLAGALKDWKLTLTPKDTLVAEVISSIVVSGGANPRSLEVIHGNGDRIVTNFSDPTPLSSAETTNAQAALNEAS
jgi:uncharacterized membrane protein